jgi:ATPase family AAA domain-containing protein 3A/B
MHFPKLGGGSSAANVPAAGSSKEAAKSLESGVFDPENLERGAEALKEIDRSKHASWAFELAAMQEKSQQLDNAKEAELQRTARMQYEQQLGAVQAEESRKTISHTADQERNTAQHKAEVESALQHRKLEYQKEQLDYQLSRENEQFLGHEDLRMKNELELEEVRRETIRFKARMDREVALDGAKADMAGRARQERENVEIRLRELRAKASEERKTRLDSIEEIFSSVSAGMSALYEDRAKTTALIGGVTALALGVYSARAGVRVASTVIERHLGRPPLVRETSRWTLRPNLGWLPWARGERPGIFDKIVLEDALSERLQWTTNALMNAQTNGTPFRHLLLHGSPGTGKTLFARTLARQSGLDYAIMSGGDLGPLGKEGAHELHKLFEWANNSRRGLVLFVDEADAFLRAGRQSDGRGMSEDARNALSVFLHHTGTENPKLSVILATNVPNMLDRAVLDRMDEEFEFPLPQQTQRYHMLQMFMEQYVRRPTKRNWSIEVDEAMDDKFLERVAKETEGMSGRQLAKLVLAFQSAVFGSGTRILTLGLAETVLNWRLQNPTA